MDLFRYKKFQLIINLFLIVLGSYSPLSGQVGSYQLDVFLEGDYDGYLFLHRKSGLDSIKVIDGKVSFSDTISEPINTGVFLQGLSNLGRIWLDTGHIEMYAHYIPATSESIHNIKVDSIYGSYAQNIFYQFRALYPEYKESGDSIWEYNLITRIIEKSQKVGSELIIMFSENLTNSEIDSLLFQLDGKYKSVAYLDFMDKIKSRNDKLSRKLDFRDLTFKNYFGEQVKLDEEVNIIEKPMRLIHVWGTWCSPCIKQFPTLKKFAEDHKEDFTLIGVATDSKKESWKALLQKYQMINHEYLEQENAAEKLNDRFDIQFFPYFILLNNENSVLARGELGNIRNFLDQR